MNLIHDNDMWPENPCCELLPPEIQKLHGRPKVMKRKEPAEIQQNMEQGKLKRMGTKNKRRGCDESSHNERWCKKRKQPESGGKENPSQQHYAVQSQHSHAPIHAQFN